MENIVFLFFFKSFFSKTLDLKNKALYVVKKIYDRFRTNFEFQVRFRMETIQELVGK
jgi:hypothetical protein